jgi:peptidoglycan/LPS O-acetylase OafA/YrhL
VGTSRHLPGLDLIRAIAISWVLLYHASILWHVPGDSWLIRFGWMGVDLFFALSGFLIGGQLLRPWARGAAPSYSHFMVRRVLRTVPAYLVILAIYFLVPWLRDGIEMKPLWQFLTFTQNLAGDLTPSMTFSPAWSLCVEEQFYLAFPLVVAVLAIRPSTTVITATILAVLLFGIGIRGYLWTHDVAMTVDGRTLLSGDRFMSLIYYPTWSRLDALLAGVVAATVQTFRPKWWRALTAWSNLLALCGVTGVALSIVFFGDQLATLLPTVFGYPLLGCSAALLVIAGSDNRSIVSRCGAVPGVRALATGAYSLYLTHKMMLHAVQRAALHWPGLQHFALGVGLMVALAAGTTLYWSVERPFLRLRERLAMAAPLR